MWLEYKWFLCEREKDTSIKQLKVSIVNVIGS